MKRRRPTTVFSLSFLDVICCGFGAIILLFVITMGQKTKQITNLRIALERIIQQRVMKLSEYDIRSEEIKLMLSIEEETAKKRDREIQDLDAMIAKLKQQLNDKKFSQDKLLVDLKTLMKEMAVLQVDIELEQKVIKPAPVGVPVESNHIAFVIDTSGSMRDPSTSLIRSHVVQKFEEVLDSYPQVDGIQLLDADGHFLMGRGMRSRWMEDNPETRDYMVRAVRLYPRESNSNPVPGVQRAIRALADVDKEDFEMGIYVLGDEFTGKSDRVLKDIYKMNHTKEDELIAKINAIGFPNVIGTTLSLSQSGLKFANLMRELTYENGGAFVALEREKLKVIDRENRDRYPLPPIRRRPTGPSIIFGP